jgi:hypothetical protein
MANKGKWLVPIIEYSDLRREAAVSTWRKWVNAALEELRATRKDREYLRFAKGPVKRFKEEVVPTLRFVERQFPGREVLMRFPADNSAADAVVRSSEQAPAVSIQVTCDWTYDEERRLRILHRDGMVAGSGPIFKRNGRLEAEGHALSLEQTTANYASTVDQRLRQKFSRCADPHMWLLLHINDERLPPEGVPRLVHEAQATARGSPYRATFLVGSSENREKPICALLHGRACLPGR